MKKCRVDGCRNLRRIDKQGRLRHSLCHKHAKRRYDLGSEYAIVQLHRATGAGTLGNHGYMQVSKSGKLYLAHRWIWEQENGAIPDGYVIHHDDGNKTNNDLSNLQCVSRSEHSRLHAAEYAT